MLPLIVKNQHSKEIQYLIWCLYLQELRNLRHNLLLSEQNPERRQEQKSECPGLSYVAVELLQFTCGLLQDLGYHQFCHYHVLTCPILCTGKRISEKLAIISSLLKDLFTSYKIVFIHGTLGH